MNAPINARQNIIAGPDPKDYWNHSPGLEQPLVREEGPFPVQGNIGELVSNDYSKCTYDPTIGLGPNCVGAFTPDIFTKTNTCGSECMLKYPESYGLKDFGFPKDLPKVSNAHQLHTYQNIRAGMQGQTGISGCYEYIPNLSVDKKTNTCYMDEKKEFQQVGNWSALTEFKNLIFPK